nr:unnamed protein product [Callosobruchus chinensis]
MYLIMCGSKLRAAEELMRSENFEDILGFKPEEKQDLMLFSDSCASQNKNTILMGTLIHFLEQCNTFSNITHVFPVRGHSYMPVDRIFGRIEKQYRKLEEMISPTDYYDILGKSGKLFCYGQDWVTKDLKTETRKIFKSKLPFKISETKVIQYKKTKCSEKISEEERKKIHKQFWTNQKSIDVKRQFIASHVQQLPIERRRERTSERKNKRQYTNRYTFESKSRLINVCKTFFLNTLSISQQTVDTAISKKREGGILSPDKRGKHGPANKIPAEVRDYNYTLAHF